MLASAEDIYEVIFHGDDTQSYHLATQWHEMCEKRAAAFNRFLQNKELMHATCGDLKIFCYASWSGKDYDTACEDWADISPKRKQIFEAYGLRLSMWLYYRRLKSGETICFTSRHEYKPFYLKVHCLKGVPIAYTMYNHHKRPIAQFQRKKIAPHDLREWLITLHEVIEVMV